MKSLKKSLAALALFVSHFSFAGGGESMALHIDSLFLAEEQEALELIYPTHEMQAFEEEWQREKFARLSEQAYRAFLKDEE